MYNVFLEPRAFCIQRDPGLICGTRPIYIKSGKQSVWEHFLSWAEDEKAEDMLLITGDPEKSFADLIGHFKVIDAAGGVVENHKGEVLMIFRLGKWDLPKGKSDKGEILERTAIREVEEECGIDSLEITKTLSQTYHAYKVGNDSMELKRTQWYLMRVREWQRPQPQTSEHITKAVWVQKEYLENLFDGAYRSIAELLRGYLNQ